MRFALLEVKLALIKILIKFDVLPGPNTPQRMEFIEGFTFRQPSTMVPVLLRKRS